jgi:hypothetical protein
MLTGLAILSANQMLRDTVSIFATNPAGVRHVVIRTQNSWVPALRHVMWSWTVPSINIIYNKMFLLVRKLQLIKCVEQSSTNGANTTLSLSRNSRLLCTQNVHYRVHNSPPPLPAPSHINPIYTLPPYLSHIYFNSNMPYTPRSYE